MFLFRSKETGLWKISLKRRYYCEMSSLLLCSIFEIPVIFRYQMITKEFWSIFFFSVFIWGKIMALFMIIMSRKSQSNAIYAGCFLLVFKCFFFAISCCQDKRYLYKVLYFFKIIIMRTRIRITTGTRIF